MGRRNSIRDFALAAFVVAGIAIMQAAGPVIPASHVFAFGNNVNGSLGIGAASAGNAGVVPTGVVGKRKFASIDGGGGTAIGVAVDGLVYTWGFAGNGRLGYPVVGNNAQPAPQQIVFAPGRLGVSVSAGAEHMLAALDDGSVWSWGASNTAGQLGRGGVSQVIQVVPGIANVKKVAAGTNFSLAIDDVGQLYGWGANQAMQLGAAGTFTTPAAMGGPALQDVAAGFQHAVAIGTDGSVWAWGANQFGQAGQNPGTPIGITQVPGLANIVAVAAGATSSFALASDGSLWAWGRESDLGVGSNNTVASHIPRQVMLSQTVALTGVTAVAAGATFGVASLDDGRYVYWGPTSGFALGLSASNQPLPYAGYGPSVGVGVSGVAAGDIHGFLMVGDPPITTSWQLGSTMTCAATNNATVTLNGYSLAGLGLIDVMLVLDESGSLDSTEFNQLKSFASNFVNQLDMNVTRVGIVMFSDSARLVLAPSGNRQQILNAINTVVQDLGNTCIGCGLNTADTTLDQNPRSGATRYIVVVTDGANNVPSQGSQAQQQQFLQAAVTNAHQQNRVLSVGVGNLIDVDELTFIASTLPGFTTVFTAADFTVLDDLVIGLVRSVMMSPGSTNAHLEAELGPAWDIVSGVPSVAGSTFTKSTNSSFSWVLPTLDAAGATLQLVLRAVAGGGDLLVPASEVYSDDQGNAFRPGTPRGVLVSGCPSTFSLTPVSSSGPINSQHVVTATLIDHFGTPIANAPVRFKFVGGPRSGTVIGNANTNAQGVATMQFSSLAPFTDVVQATLQTNTAFVSNTAERTWLPPNAPPIANAGPDQVVGLVDSPTVAVTLNGSASTDDGQRQPLTYGWTSDSGFTASGVTAVVNLPFGTHTFTLIVWDGEHTKTDTMLVTVNDPSPPEVTADVAGALGLNGWYVSDVSVSFTFDDPESGIASTSNCQPVAIATDTLGQTLTCDVVNGAGIARSASATIKRDATKPVVETKEELTGIAQSPQGAQVPYSPPGASDAASGVALTYALCTPPPNSLFPIGTTAVNCTATDNAGNVGSNTFNLIVNDPTPPVITPVIDGPLGNGGWYRGDVSISWTVNDPHSGVGSSNGCDAVTVMTDTASATFTCAATNNAGVSNSVSTTIKRDTAPPIVTTPANLFASASSAAGAVVNYANATAVDDLSGVAGAVVCAPASGSQFPMGATNVNCSAADAAGNAGSASFMITVGDTTPPSIVPNVIGTPGSNGWYTSDVAISFTIVDGESAVSSTAGCDAITLSTDTAGQTFTCSATSGGGSSTQSVTVKRDVTAPAWTMPGNLSITTPDPGGAAVTFAASPSDGGSGVSGSSCAPASGSTFPIGTTTVNCSATDSAGNGSAASFNVTVTFGSDEPGRMHGEGHIIADNHQVSFDFAVAESAKKGERGRVDIRIRRGRNGRFDDDRFDSRSVGEVVFSNAPAYSPGRNPKTGIDTVIFTGTGRWDRRDGYTFTVSASDRGEPGRHVDTFTIEVKAPNGQVVFSGGGPIANGNVQSNRMKR